MYEFQKGFPRLVASNLDGFRGRLLEQVYCCRQATRHRRRKGAPGEVWELKARNCGVFFRYLLRVGHCMRDLEFLTRFQPLSDDFRGSREGHRALTRQCRTRVVDLEMTDTAEWRTRAIWDSLEAGSYKQALQLCSKHLKKTPNSPLLQALAALATLKMGKVEEALKLCDSARKLPGALDPSVLPVLAQVYNQAGKRKGVSKMYEEASLAFPRNEELAVLWHMSLARDMNLKEQQQVRV